MNVLVTGGAGYIGSHTVHALLSAGFEVVVFDNLSTGFRESVPSKALFVHGDIRDRELLSKTMIEYKISSVIHFAAKTVVPDSISNPLDYYDNNTYGVLTLAQVCRDVGISKFVFSSTAAVYGNVESGSKIVETMATCPINPYGMSKLMSEKILQDSGQAHNLKYVCLRYFNVAGAAADGGNGQRTKNATHLIKVVSEVACAKRSYLQIFGTDYNTPDGTGIRDYIHVEDLADLHVLSLQYLYDGGESEIFNCGYGEGFSVRQVLETFKDILKSPISAIECPRRSGDPECVVADSSKIKKCFKWTPKRNNLRLICESALEWEKKLTNLMASK